MGGSSSTLSIILKLQDEATAALQSAGEKLVSTGESIQRAGQKMTIGLTVPLVGIGTAATKSAADFQAAMTMLVTQAGLPADQLQRLTKEVQAFADSGAQQAPEVLAQGLYHIVSLGVPAADAMAVLKLSSEGAAISGANLEDVANALGAAVASNIKGSGDYAQSMAILNATVGAGNMRMQDLAQALGYVLPQATVAGLSLKDVGAAMATMTDNGMQAEVASNHLRMAVSLMSAPTREAQKALEEVGITQFALADDMRNKGLLSALQDLHDHLIASGKTANEQSAVLSKAFGGAQTAGAIELLLNNLDRVGQKYQLIDEGVNKFGTDVQMQSQTAAAEMAAAQAKISDALVKLGGAIMPLISEVLPKLVSGLTAAVALFTRLPKPVQDGVLVLLALLAVLGPILIVIGSLVTAVGTVGTAFAFLATGPALAITAAIVGVGAAVYELIKHWQDLKTIVGDILDWFGGKLDWLLSKINAVGGALGSAVSGVASVGKSIGGGISSAFNSVVKMFASGGIVNGPTLAMVGEAGPEAIIPLSAFEGGPGLAGANLGGGAGIVVNVNGGYYLDQQAARDFGDMLAKTIGQQLKLRSI